MLPKSRGSSAQRGDSRNVWNAVALQDHLSHSLRVLERRSREGSRQRQITAARRRQLSGVPMGSAAGYVSEGSPLRVLSKRRTDSSAGSEGTAVEDRQALRNANNNRLSLAQKLGLLDSPPSPPTAEEWELACRLSDSRRDGDKPCAICLEDFKQRPQVILSCSHVYHADCLRSFESFLEEDRVCPLCRSKGYHKRPHYSGEEAWRQTCAKTIQKLWRGYSARKRIFDYLGPVAPDGAVARNGQPILLRRKYGAKALRAVNGKLIKEAEDTQNEVERFLTEMGESVRSSRDLITQGLADLERLQSHQHTDSAALFHLQTAASYDSCEADRHRAEDVPPCCWQDVARAAARRGETECPICCQALQQTHNRQKPVFLLSCSHVFHKSCILSFERFHLYEASKCPVCRSPYSKQIWCPVTD